MAHRDSHAAAGQELERIINRMRAIQRNIRASNQPPAGYELDELRSLGREYARIVERLSGFSGDTE